MTTLKQRSFRVRFDTVGTVLDTIQTPAWVEAPPTLRAQGERSVSARRLPFAPRVIFAWSAASGLLSGPSTPCAFHVTHGAGRPLRIEQEWTAVKVLPDESEYARDELTWAMRTIAPNWTWNGPGIPETKPAYERLQSGEDGRIWVKVHSTAARVEPEEPPPAEPGQPPRPVQRYAEPNVYDVFAANGTYLGRVGADRSRQIMRLRGDYVWGVLTDSLGIAYVARGGSSPPFSALK